jgi:hypothetical protein
MSTDEESLMQRFTRVFWKEFIQQFKPELLNLNAPQTKAEVNLLKNEIRRLIDDANTVSVSLSSNECIEDAATSSLLFSVLPYVCGYLVYHHSQFDKETRAQVLHETRTSWMTFINYVKQLEIIPNKPTGDPRDVRRDSLVKRRLLRPAFLTVFKASDIDDVRDSIIDILEYFSLECKEEFRFVDEEIEILKFKNDAAEKSSVIRNEPPKKPWSLKIDKSNIRSLMANQVFRPDISMPSMSLDDFAKLEMERMQASSTAVSTPQEPSENDDEYYKQSEMVEDREKLRAREWDDWKDDNPRGSGNKLVNLG